MTSKTTIRPPVVVVLGHVDHGKSTLLDYLRQTNVVAGEAGGITQHLGAYEVKHQTAAGQEHLITFLDTPGHEAFSALRARGAEIADLAILVVSTEEGVKAQTVEAWQAITANKLPYVVALTKTDRPNANLERTKQSLAEQQIFIEGYGGTVPAAAVSAKTGEGVAELLDLVLLVAELAELKGEPDEPASGFVLEAFVEPKAGVLTTLIIKNGTLHQGDLVVVGDQLAKIRRLENFLGQTIASATFSAPVGVFGFVTVPAVGGRFTAFNDKKAAEATATANQSRPVVPLIKNELATPTAVIVPIVIKGDVSGTLEALEQEINKQATAIVQPKIVQRGLGPITENDIRLAGGKTKPLVIGFNVKTDAAAKELAERQHLTIQTFNIIYKMSEWLAVELATRKPATEADLIIGTIKILKIFSRHKDKQIVGGQVLEGLVARGKPVKIVRREAPLGYGKITGLQLERSEVKEVPAGKQFGAVLDSKLTIAVGDTLVVLASELKE